jgi:hypothetical protein
MSDGLAISAGKRPGVGSGMAGARGLEWAYYSCAQIDAVKLDFRSCSET